MTDLYFDAIVIGAGPAGGTAALLLARAGWRVAVVEKAGFPRKKVCGEFLSATNAALLERLGLIDLFEADAGPEVREVGLFAGQSMLKAPMPKGPLATRPWGRALAREHLDTLLLERARLAGATVYQPFKANSVQCRPDGLECIAQHGETHAEVKLRAPIMLAAHGSWETGLLPTQATHRAPRANDFHGFKAHFQHSSLNPELMPLLAFPGGYGGMVRVDRTRTSLSCCIRFDELSRARARYADRVGSRAADALLMHLRDTTRGVAEALDGALLEGSWLAAGPIRPGFRQSPDNRILLLGNAAGEAHPIVAEGISMAMQSAWLACEALQRCRGSSNALHDTAQIAAVAREYRQRWRSAFAPRIRASTLFAQLAVRPGAVNLLLPVVRHWPALLTLGAHLSGKSHQVVTPARPIPG
jgi:flavin-dependent dehydrogenase